jgi:cytochrome P450
VTSRSSPAYPFTWPEVPGFPDELQTLRREPLASVTLPSGDPAVLVTRYADVRKALLDTRVSHNLNQPGAAKISTDDFLFRDPNVNYDPPDHPRARRLIAKAFTPARVERMRPRIAEIAAGLVERMRETGPPAEFNATLAYPLTIQIICELLGVPASDTERFRGWTSDVLLLGAQPGDVGANDKVMHALMELYGYAGQLIGLRRAEPGNDLVSALIAARDEDLSELSDGEMLHWILAVLIGGYHTTAAALGGALVTLFAHPDQLAVLLSDMSLLDNAVEELLRWGGVAQPLPTLRYVTDDLPLDGAVIPAGTSIIAAIDSANRDETVFTGPEYLDLRRAENPHLSFGLGNHFCVGAALARAELQEALRALLTGLPELRCAVELADLPREQGLIFQDFTELPVTWGSR